MFTVLITGCSKHSKGVVDCLTNNYDNQYVRVIGVDCNKNNLLKAGVAHTFVVPRVDDKRYLPKLRSICTQLGVNVILPYITSELEILSLNKTYFEEVGVHVSVSSLESLKIVNDKVKLYEKYKQFMPEQIVAKNKDEAEHFINEHEKVCCKISNGCGGTGFAIVDDKKAYDMSLFNKARVPRYITKEFLYECIERFKGDVILQEYIEGIDYSTCILSNNGDTLGICGYEGMSMEYGAVMSGIISKNDTAYDIHKQIVKDLGIDGNSCADFIINKKQVKLLEINPRLNASLPFVSEAGANFIYDRCKMLVGQSFDTDYNIKYGLEMRKYYENEYF